MNTEKIITHVELSINPTFLEAVLQEATTTRDKILLEAGTESFTLTKKKEESNTLVVFAVYASQESYTWHLQQEYVKSFFIFLQDKLTTMPKTTHLTLL